MEALWTGGADAPPEYLELVLCRDIYHCTPDELAAQDVMTVLTHLALHNKEQQVRGWKEKAAADKAKAAASRRRRR